MTTDFLEKFLPKYHSREDVARYLDLDKCFRGEMSGIEKIEKDIYRSNVCYLELVELQEKLHAEALQNFTDKICEKQRENVCRNFLNNDHHDTDEIIMCSKVPKIDEI